MKSLFMKLGLVWIMLISLLPSAFSQGVLVIEISDILNMPLSDYYVRIKDSNGNIKSYKTDSEGRVRDDNFPVGDYSYSFSYGDYNSGSFTVKSGEYTWVDLDFRSVTVNFKDENNLPTSGNFVTLYKREADGSRTLVSQKTSGEDGAATFVVPEGNYTYVAADGEHDIVVKDQNINTTVSVSSKVVTYQTAFRFVRGSEVIPVYAKDITISQSQNGSFKSYGIVLAHGDNQSNGYVEYSITDGKISCPVGEYKYSVRTRDYGTITGIFYVTQNDSQTDNIVDIVFPEEKGEGGSEGTPEIITPNEGEPTYKLYVHVCICDSGTPVNNIAANYSIAGSGKSVYKPTDKNGYSMFIVNEGTYDVNIPGITKEGIHVNKDTVINFCVPKGPGPKYQHIYFKFYYKGEEVFPQTIESIDIDKIEYGSYNTYGEMIPVKDSVTGVKKFVDPLITTMGKYYYSFRLNEYNATYRSGTFTTDTLKQKDTVKIYFEEKLNVDIYVLHHDSTPANNAYNITYVDSYKSSRRTDNAGHLQMIMTPGQYKFMALDQSVDMNLVSDTAIYFFLPKEGLRNVYFKFLHDGEVVYPNVTTLSFYKDNSSQTYAYLSSTLYQDYLDLGETYVFDKPIELPADTFTASYYIEDYEFDGQMAHEFYLNASPNDTTIYIVIPVKRTASIQILDANEAKVQGVFAEIYKYNEDGTLSPYLDYDGNSHRELMSDATGIVRDLLVPGRYQIQILDIKRDFDVNDYDLNFTIKTNVDLYNVKFTVLYKDDNTPVENLKIDIKKGKEFYNSGITNKDGSMEFESEEGLYTYTLNYGNGISDSYKITKKDEEFVIYVNRPVLVNTIAVVGGEQCLTPGESTKFTVLVMPENATQKNLEWSIDNSVIANISSDGTLTANSLGLTGVVTVTAKAKDDSGVSKSFTVSIEEEKCVKSYRLTFGDGSTEMWLTDYTFDLVVTPLVEKHEYYGYQTSQDGVHWTSAADFTLERKVTVASDRYLNTGTYLFRAIAADDAYDLLQILDGHVEPDPENVTNIIFLHYDGGDVMDNIMIPTVFTPHEINGANDDFMPGYPVVIYNRFGDVICKSDYGWNGTYKGEIADAGVYIYVLTLKDGREVKGTIQLYRK